MEKLIQTYALISQSFNRYQSPWPNKKNCYQSPNLLLSQEHRKTKRHTDIKKSRTQKHKTRDCKNPYQTTITDSSRCWASATTRSNWLSLLIGCSSTDTGESSSSSFNVCPSWLATLRAEILLRAAQSKLEERTTGMNATGSVRGWTIEEDWSESRDGSRGRTLVGLGVLRSREGESLIAYMASETQNQDCAPIQDPSIAAAQEGRSK